MRVIQMSHGLRALGRFSAKSISFPKGPKKSEKAGQMQCELIVFNSNESMFLEHGDMALLNSDPMHHLRRTWSYYLEIVLRCDVIKSRLHVSWSSAQWFIERFSTHRHCPVCTCIDMYEANIAR